jgi:hypothetical protein
VLGVGVFFFWLHSLPERMVHNKIQFDIVAVLALLSLFTHQHAFWVAALLIAIIDLPNFSIPNFSGLLERIASSLEAIATSRREPAAPQASLNKQAEIPDLKAQDQSKTAEIKTLSQGKSPTNQPESGSHTKLEILLCSLFTLLPDYRLWGRPARNGICARNVVGRTSSPAAKHTGRSRRTRLSRHHVGRATHLTTTSFGVKS